MITAILFEAVHAAIFDGSTLAELKLFGFLAFFVTTFFLWFCCRDGFVFRLVDDVDILFAYDIDIF